MVSSEVDNMGNAKSHFQNGGCQFYPQEVLFFLNHLLLIVYDMSQLTEKVLAKILFTSARKLNKTITNLVQKGCVSNGTHPSWT